MLRKKHKKIIPKKKAVIRASSPLNKNKPKRKRRKPRRTISRVKFVEKKTIKDFIGIIANYKQVLEYSLMIIHIVNLVNYTDDLVLEIIEPYLNLTINIITYSK